MWKKLHLNHLGQILDLYNASNHDSSFWLSKHSIDGEQCMQ